MAKASRGKRENGDRGLPPGLTRALAEPKANADSAALLSDIIDVWGGVRRLATVIHAEYQRAGPGSQTRQRLLQMIQSLILTNTTNEIGRVTRPADMSDEELQAVALYYMKKVLGDAAPPAAEQ